jgi:hypothetical protein
VLCRFIVIILSKHRETVTRLNPPFSAFADDRNTVAGRGETRASFSAWLENRVSRVAVTRENQVDSLVAQTFYAQFRLQGAWQCALFS